MIVSLPTFSSSLADEMVALATPCADTDFVTHATGVHNPPSARFLLDHMLPVVEKVVGRTLEANCTFCRIYGRGSVLQAHTDRSSLDWTVSIQLRSDAPWGIEVNEGGRWNVISTVAGQGVLINGSVIQHRRSQPFSGIEAVVLLLHYTERIAFKLVKSVLSLKAVEHISRNVCELQDGTVRSSAQASKERIARIAWLSRTSEWRWVYDLLFVAASIANVWGLDITGDSPDDVQFARYGVGGKYDWHLDRDETVRAKRTLSMVVLLQHPEEGGGFELKRGGVVPLEPGDACVFPSREYHRALPVVSGIRETLTLWLAETN